MVFRHEINQTTELLTISVVQGLVEPDRMKITRYDSRYFGTHIAKCRPQSSLGGTL